MCFDIGSRHLGCWGQNTSRIQNKEVYATLCLQAGWMHSETLTRRQVPNPFVPRYFVVEVTFSVLGGIFSHQVSYPIQIPYTIRNVTQIDESYA